MASVTHEPFSGRARLAWTIVLLNFILFVSLCLSIPLGLNFYVQTATSPLPASLVTNQGTVAILKAEGEPAAVRHSDPARPLTSGDEVVTNATDTAQLLIYALEESERLLVRGQLYGNSNLTINKISSPRFSWNNDPQEIVLDVKNGRVRLTVLPAGQRAYKILLLTPHGTIALLAPGQYSLVVNNEGSQLAVQNGRAELESLATGGTLTLTDTQRGVLHTTAAPEGPLTTNRNLVQNGDFGQGLQHWIKRDWNIERSDQPKGETLISELAGERRLRFVRVGIGHADVGVRQVVEQDVTDLTDLRLLVSFRVNQQTVGVCGTVGSECPLTVRIEYRDSSGTPLVWQQGFYATGNIGPTTPDSCVNCTPPHIRHVLVPSNLIFSYETNLLESLAFYGAPPPSFIDSVSLIAAGHSFETEIIEVALLAGE